MTEQPVSVTEMAIRHALQALWFTGLAAVCLYFAWPGVLWGIDGFPENAMPEPAMLLLHGFLAVLAMGWGLRAAELIFFRLIPWALARLLRGGPAKIRRKG